MKRIDPLVTGSYLNAESQKAALQAGKEVKIKSESLIERTEAN